MEYSLIRFNDVAMMDNLHNSFATGNCKVTINGITFYVMDSQSILESKLIKIGKDDVHKLEWIFPDVTVSRLIPEKKTVYINYNDPYYRLYFQSR